MGRYQIHGRLGGGGMAVVHRATLTGPGGFEKEVALKVVPEQALHTEENVKALVNEARIGGQMRHPNIVEVYELGQDGDHYYVAMELVRGKTLAEILDRCRETGVRLPRAVVLEIAMQVTSGLHYAHGFRTSKGKRAGLIHRDLKPPNLMLDERGTVKIMDFGIARSSLNLYMTTTGNIVKGTPMYIAPEQLEGAELTPAVDFFAFGVILYELLTNRRLFLAVEAQAIIARVLVMDIEPFLEPLREVDAELAELVARCLERAVADRSSSARELYQQLADLREDDPSEVTLMEFVRYLQQAPKLGLVQRDPENDFSWTILDVETVNAGTSIDDDEESVSLRRPLEAVARDLEAFGTLFFGPIRHGDPDGMELEASQRGEAPSLHFEMLGPGAGKDTGADTVRGVTQAMPEGTAGAISARKAEMDAAVSDTADAGAAPGSPPSQTTLSSQPVARTAASEAETVLPPAIKAVEEPGARSNSLLIVGVLVVVALVLGGVLAVLAWPRSMDPQEATTEYLAAVEAGDATRAAEVIAALPADAADDPEGRTLLALDAALAGETGAAREHLGDVSSYPQPARSRARIVLAGIHRQEAGAAGYRAAANSYADALDCTGDGCGALIEAARAGLLVSCATIDGTLPDSCARVELPAWRGAGEPELVRSVLLLDDGHLDQARTALVRGLDRAEAGASCGCAGAAALRVWVSEAGANPADSPLAGRVEALGKRESRDAGDCRLFAGVPGS